MSETVEELRKVISHCSTIEPFDGLKILENGYDLRIKLSETSHRSHLFDSLTEVTAFVDGYNESKKWR